MPHWIKAFVWALVGVGVGVGGSALRATPAAKDTCTIEVAPTKDRPYIVAVVSARWTEKGVVCSAHEETPPSPAREDAGSDEP